MPFAELSEGSGDTLALADTEGHILIVKPTSHEQGIATSFGEKDAIRVDCVDLTQEGAIYRDVLWFAGGVIGKLKRHIGETVLVSISKGVAKAGQQPPWVVTSELGNAAAVNAAELWMQNNPDALNDTPAVPSGLGALTATPAAPVADRQVF